VSPTSGVGSASATLDVAETTRSDSRTLTLTFNSLTATVVQEGYGCVYTLSAAAIEARNEGSVHSIHVTAPPDCRWSVTTNDSWITVNTAGGSGSDYVSITVAPNTADARQGSVTIAGQRIIVTQPQG
jgi:hypothetical protein